MEVSASSVELDVEVAYDDNLGRAHDIGHRRVDLAVEVLEVNIHHEPPGLLVVAEDDAEKELYDSPLCRGELASLNLRMESAVAAEIVVHEAEYEPCLDRDEGCSLERLEMDHVEARRHEERMDILTELEHLDALHLDLGLAAQHIEEADAEVPREALVDELQGRHVSADNTLLAQEVIGGYLLSVLAGGRLFLALVI